MQRENTGAAGHSLGRVCANSRMRQQTLVRMRAQRIACSAKAAFVADRGMLVGAQGGAKCTMKCARRTHPRRHIHLEDRCWAEEDRRSARNHWSQPPLLRYVVQLRAGQEAPSGEQRGLKPHH